MKECKCFRIEGVYLWQTYLCEIHKTELDKCLEIVEKKSYTIEEIEKSIINNLYENDILEKLQGDNPKQKYEYLINLLKISEDYMDLVVKLKKANNHPLVNVTLNQFKIIVSEL